MVDIVAVGPRISLRRTRAQDLAYVTSMEQSEQNRRFVSQDTESRHRQMLRSKDISHLIVQHGGKSIGFLILSGVANRSGSIELKRLVIQEKGLGFGRESLRLCLQLAFNTFRAHRLSLDVVEYNHRAINLYLSEGFKQEGLLRECDFFEGKYNSLIIMSVLRREYEQRSIDS